MNNDEAREAVLDDEQRKQLRAGLKERLGPLADMIPDAKLNDPEFLVRAIAASQGQPIPTGTVAIEKKEQPAPEIKVEGIDMNAVMSMAGPMLKAFDDQMTRQLEEVQRLKAGLKVMFDHVSHLVTEIHAMNDGCLLAAKVSAKK